MPLVTRRSTGRALALFATIALAASVWGGVASARTRTVRNFSVSMTPCVLPNSTTTLSATFTNSSSSTQSLGSIYLDTSEFWFTGITPDTAFVLDRSDWTGHLESAYGFAGDRNDLDGLYLTANSSSAALAAGASVTVTFPVTVGSSTGLKTWLALGWTGTTPYTGSLFSLTSTRVNVTNSCVGAASKVVFTTQPPSSQAATAPFSVAAQLQDDGGHAITSGGTQISLNLNQNGNAGALSGSPTATTVNGTGIATFSGLSVDKVGTGYTLTASSSGLTSADSNGFNIVAGAPAQVTFVAQPTDTLVNEAISAPGGVKVHVTDAGNNDIPNQSVTLKIDPSSPASGAGITGDSATTDSSGIATFDNLQIDTTSSGYILDADASGVGSSPNSATFAITNTDSNCDPCTATFGNDESTVTAPPGTTLIIENNNAVDCGTSFGSPIAGTVTIIPSGSGPKLITFVDPYGVVTPELHTTYPVCKSLNGGGTVTLDYGNSEDRCPAVPPTLSDAPCIESQSFEVGTLDMYTKVWITNTDPIMKH
jgi:hypothetical protein